MKSINTIEEIQRISLNILIQFDDFCKQHNLRYSLAAGTLLGAVRHKGFIPWDDDVDILMPRPDYDKLISSDVSIGENLALYCLNNMDMPFFAYAKLADDTTLLHEQIRIENSMGVNIDIFPIDGLPKDFRKIKKHFKKLSLYKRLITLTTINISKGKTKKGYILKVILIPPARLFLKLPSLVKKVDKISREYSFEESELVAPQTLNYGIKEVLPREVFENYTKLEFCGHMFSSIKDYDKYLTQLFNDYMVLPPENDRISTHTYDAYYK